MVELGEDEVQRRLSILTGLEASKVSMEIKVEPFRQWAPPSEVNLFLDAL